MEDGRKRSNIIRYGEILVERKKIMINFAGV
jgi:hypothetical protein